MATEPQPSLPARIWTFVTTASTLAFVWQIAASMVAASTVVSFLPGGWHPPQYWLVAGSVFFVTWAVAATITASAQAVVPWVRRWWHSPSLTLTPDSGMKGSITVTHHGYPTTYSVEGRVINLLSGATNPAPQQFDSYFLKGTGHYPKLKFNDGDWAQVVLADVGENEWNRRTWLSLRRGVSSPVNVPDSGALMEITIRSTPPGGGVVRSYEVIRTAMHHIAVTEMPTA